MEFLIAKQPGNCWRIEKPKLIRQVYCEVCCHFTLNPKSICMKRGKELMRCLCSALKLSMKGIRGILLLLLGDCPFLSVTFLFQWQLNIGINHPYLKLTIESSLFCLREHLPVMMAIVTWAGLGGGEHVFWFRKQNTAGMFFLSVCFSQRASSYFRFALPLLPL